MESSNRRLTLFEQMSAVDNGRTSLAAAFTLDALLGNTKPPQQPPSHNRTLLEIILDDGSNKDKKSWKAFRDKIRLKRPGSALTSSVHVPVSDVNVQTDRSQLPRRGPFLADPDDSVRVEDGGERAPVSDPPVLNSLLRLERTDSDSDRFGHDPMQPFNDDSADVSMPSNAPPLRRVRPQTDRNDSNRLPSSNTAVNNIDSSEDDDSPLARHVTRQLGAVLAEERALSAREAAEAAAAAVEQAAVTVNNAPPASEEPVRMSLMELLEETSQQMGLMGSSYIISDAGEEYEKEEVTDEEEDEKEVVQSSGGMEHACCVCMVRHKGAAFIPCGHTFCRLCSRELWVQRGNCPLCNGSILEILDIF
ncbi:hypothetical protein Gohar_012997 [Gossypium harknessii]|uniref:RING-type domain-containing protein n=1 Tax=Gossypium harknessii TaxID=34285 RepID=A0A7J9GYS3_9ROSI|nr:hypothetical protein [Gossypium harknessii]